MSDSNTYLSKIDLICFNWLSPVKSIFLKMIQFWMEHFHCLYSQYISLYIVLLPDTWGGSLAIVNREV